MEIKQAQSVSAFSNQFLGNLEQFVQSKIQEELQKQKEILETEYQKEIKKEQEEVSKWIELYDKLEDEKNDIIKQYNKLFYFTDRVIEEGKNLASQLEHANIIIDKFPKKEIFIEEFIKCFYMDKSWVQKDFWENKKPRKNKFVDRNDDRQFFFKDCFKKGCRTAHLTKNMFFEVLRNEKLIKIQKNFKNELTQKAIALGCLMEKCTTPGSYRLAITESGQEYFKELLKAYSFHYVDSSFPWEKGNEDDFYRNSAITNFNNTLYNDPRLKTNTK